MDWLKGLAPTLFDALTGNIPGAIGSAIKFLNQKFGWNNTTVKEVSDKLAGLTPEQQLQFAQLDLEFAEEQTKNEQLELADTANARNREVMLVEAGDHDKTVPILTYLILSLFTVMVAFLCLAAVPASNANIIWFLAGQVSSFAGSVVVYYFGSSKGSADKNRLIESMQNRQNK